MSGIKNIKKKLKGFQVRPPNAEVIKKVLLHIPYMVVFYVVNKCTWLYQYCRGGFPCRIIVLLPEKEKIMQHKKEQCTLCAAVLFFRKNVCIIETVQRRTPIA